MVTPLVANKLVAGAFYWIACLMAPLPVRACYRETLDGKPQFLLESGWRVSANPDWIWNTEEEANADISDEVLQMSLDMWQALGIQFEDRSL